MYFRQAKVPLFKLIILVYRITNKYVIAITVGNGLVEE